MVKPETKRLLGFDDTWVLLLGIPVLAFLIPILFFNATLADGLVAYLPEFLTSLMFTIAYWVVVRGIFIRMRRKYPQHTQTRPRLLYSLLAILTAFFIIHTLLDMVHEQLMPHPDRPGVTEFNYAVGSLTIILLVSALYEGVYFYDRWRASMVEQEKLRREYVESQLAGLRDQVNPHFLFNSLNTLAYLIPEDPQRAVQFVRKLSKVYRYVLEMRDKQLIPLAEELAFLDAYVFLLKERFGDNLQVDIDIPAGRREDRVVPLSLQMLFENAIKHNIISHDKPLTIRLFVEDDDRLVVLNKLQVRNQPTHSTGIGLENIRSRYAFFCDRPVVVEQTEAAFRVELPLLAAPEGVVVGR